MTQKICYKCKKTLDRSEFTADKTKHDGLHGRCKSCHREAKKQVIKDVTKDVEKNYVKGESRIKYKTKRRLIDQGDTRYDFTDPDWFLKYKIDIAQWRQEIADKNADDAEELLAQGFKTCALCNEIRPINLFKTQTSRVSRCLCCVQWKYPSMESIAEEGLMYCAGCCTYADVNTAYEKRCFACAVKQKRKLGVASAKARAEEKGWDFNLVASEIIYPDTCPVLGIKIYPFIRDNGAHIGNVESLDRVDSSKGYTMDNVRVISNRANVLKSNGTLEEFEKIVMYMRTFE